jgi:hypothetical protein
MIFLLGRRITSKNWYFMEWKGPQTGPLNDPATYHDNVLASKHVTRRIVR